MADVIELGGKKYEVVTTAEPPNDLGVYMDVRLRELPDEPDEVEELAETLCNEADYGMEWDKSTCQELYRRVAKHVLANYVPKPVLPDAEWNAAYDMGEREGRRKAQHEAAKPRIKPEDLDDLAEDRLFASYKSGAKAVRKAWESIDEDYREEVRAEILAMLNATVAPDVDFVVYQHAGSSTTGMRAISPRAKNCAPPLQSWTCDNAATVRRKIEQWYNADYTVLLDKEGGGK
jgi:hypothetical protein